MKIAIYDRYWNTAGGGEKYTSQIAEVLSRFNEVILISVEDVDWKGLEAKLSVNLSRCQKIKWPNIPCWQLAPRTIEYDVFVNATYKSTLPSRAKKSILICYFPHQIIQSKLKSIYQKIKNWIKKNLIEKKSAINGLEIIGGTFDFEDHGGMWISENAIFNVRVSESTDTLTLPLIKDVYCGIKEVLNNGLRVKWFITSNSLIINGDFSNGDLLNIISEGVLAGKIANNDDPRIIGACLSWKEIDLVAQISDFNDEIKNLNTYHEIISISKYTSLWIEKYWKRSPSYLIHPAVDYDITEAIPPKEKIIISVGRYFPGHHNKKHDIILQLFIKLKDEGILSDEWKLVLIGGLDEGNENHVGYFQEIQQKSAGNSIEVYKNIDFKSLQNWYGKSQIYIHASGYMENEENSPDKFEHFGMTICEAMAAGCIPFVYGAGGQKEIIDITGIGYSYKNYAELKSSILDFLMKSNEDTYSLSCRSKESMSKFSLHMLEQKVLAMDLK